eukprot:COSAG02_NODE_29487_length_568_cov_0.957356_2_plen_74_part_01
MLSITAASTLLGMLASPAIPAARLNNGDVCGESRRRGSEDSVERVAAVLAAVQISIATRSDIPGLFPAVDGAVN